ncbi:MAG: M36 family metallopeptidase [Blastocatellia bacterium]
MTHIPSHTLCLLCATIALTLALSPHTHQRPATATMAGAARMETQASGPRAARPQTLENFDIRVTHQHSLTGEAVREAAGHDETRQQKMARAALSQNRAVTARWSSLTGAPARWWNQGNAAGNGPLSQTEALPGNNLGAETRARGFLRQNQTLFRLNETDIADLQLVRTHRAPRGGMTLLTLQQRAGGLEVFQGDMNIAISRAGEVIAASGELMPEAEKALNLKSPRLSSAQAMLNATRAAGVTDPRADTFTRETGARLLYFPLAAGQLRLAWQFTLWMRATPDVYLILIDADNGSLLWRHNLTSYENDPLNDTNTPRGLVFTGESPRPNLPRTGGNPVNADREDKPFRADSWNGQTLFAGTDAHYDWWAGGARDTLRGNNALVAADRNGDDQPDLPLPTATQGNFAWPLNLDATEAGENNLNAAQANLYYWINRYHDILYTLGFTESAGNFQRNNFGLGGADGDAIYGDVADGSGYNNANFTTLPDGLAARVQMFLWTNGGLRDSAFDQTVVLHELTHGLSQRLVGNATGLTGTQAGALGEGWSDFYALALLAPADSDPAAAWPLAQYATSNYQKGIRRFPYSTDLKVNPLTLDDFTDNTRIHAIGEIWCAALWEARAALLEKHGYAAGQRLALQLITDGMKLTPRAPSFIDARDAILAADRVDNDGANQAALWKAFARRGLGYSAETSDTNDMAPVAAFDTPPWCQTRAQLYLGRDSFLNGENMTVTLYDANAGAAPSVQVISSVTRDRETLALTVDETTPGIYRGAIRLIAGAAFSGDGQLQASVEAGDQIQVLYEDREGDNLNSLTSAAGLAREKVVFEDTVERGNKGWVAAGAWGMTETRSASATHSWTDSPGRKYNNSEDTTLTSPLFNLRGLGEVTLSFSHSYQLDDGPDAALIEYSADDGATWIRAAAWTRAQNEFGMTTARLRGLDNKAHARFRFRLRSDSSRQGEGWFIDDIRLTGRSASAQVIAPDSAQAPFISAITPAHGAPAGGAQITISGGNFTEAENTMIRFDTQPAAGVRVISANTMIVNTPAHLPGATTVRITNRLGETALTDGFTYYNGNETPASAAILGVTPASGPVRGGNIVTLFGHGFSPDTRVSFGARAANISYVNSQTLRVTVPANDAGPVDLSLATGAATARLANGYSFVAAIAPRVEALTPAAGATLYAGATYNITWRSTDNGAITRHRLRLEYGSGDALMPYEITDAVSGDAQSWAWTIPADHPAARDMRVSVTAIDDEGEQTIARTGLIQIAPRWERRASLPADIQDFAIAGDGLYMYLAGGRSTFAANTAMTTLWRLDTTATRQAWRGTGLAQMPVATGGIGAALLNQRIHVPGGVGQSGGAMRLHQVYSIADNSWDQAEPLPAPRTEYAMVSDPARNRFYVIGGREAATNYAGVHDGARAQLQVSAMTTVYEYDAAADRWNTLPPMNTARAGHQAALIDGKLYVSGGVGPAGLLNTGEVFDFATGQWSPIAAAQRHRMGATSVTGSDTADNALWIVFGGYDGATSMADTEAYDPRANRWLRLDGSFSLPTTRSLITGVAMNGWFHAIGGMTIGFAGGEQVALSQRVNECMRIDNLAIGLDKQAPALAVPETQVAVAGHEISFGVLANDPGASAQVTLNTGELPPGAQFTAVNETPGSARGVFRWRPAASEAGRAYRIAFTASDGTLAETRVVTLRVAVGGKLAAVNAASFGAALAPDSIATIFAAGLATQTQSARVLPLPRELGGTIVRVNGVAAQLLFVSPTQINFIVPPESRDGDADVIVSSPLGQYAAGISRVSAAAPGIFTIEANGAGDAAAFATPDGLTWQAAPFDVLVGGRPNNLILYGTGLRRAAGAGNPADGNGVAEAVSVTIDGVPAAVMFAGAQGGYSGLDQVNIELPATLSGRSERRVELILRVNGVAANPVSVIIR